MESESIKNDSQDDISGSNVKEDQDLRQQPHLNYVKPKWSGLPEKEVYLEGIKNGVIVETTPVITKEFFVIGRLDECDLVLNHESISRYHAVIQFKVDASAFVYDLGSTHGTFLNKKRLQPRVYTLFHEEDIITFGASKRIYFLHVKNQEFLSTISKNVLQNVLSEKNKTIQNKNSDEPTYSEIRTLLCNLAKDLHQEILVEFDMVSQNSEKLYRASIELDIDEIIVDGGIIKLDTISSRKKDAEKSLIFELYKRLKSLDAFSIIKQRNIQRENLKLAFKSYHSDDDSVDTSKLQKKKRNLMTFDSLNKEKADLDARIEELRLKLSSCQEKIKPSLPLEDEIDQALNDLQKKEAENSIKVTEKELKSLEAELNEVLRLMKIATPSTNLISNSEIFLPQGQVHRKEVKNVEIVNDNRKVEDKFDESRNHNDFKTPKRVPKVGLNVPPSRRKRDKSSPENPNIKRLKPEEPSKTELDTAQQLAGLYDDSEVEDLNFRTTKKISQSEIEKLNAQYGY